MNGIINVFVFQRLCLHEVEDEQVPHRICGYLYTFHNILLYHGIYCEANRCKRLGVPFQRLNSVFRHPMNFPL